MMNGADLLFASNANHAPRPKIINSVYVYTCKSVFLDLQEIKRIIGFFNQLKVPIPVTLDLRHVRLFDKLSYTFLECICYRTILQKHITIKVLLFGAEHNIRTVGITSSPLLLLNAHNIENRNRFLKQFESELYRNHYRKLVKAADNIDGDAVSRVMTDVKSFLGNLFVETECATMVSDAVAELVDNSLEHAETDCLVDVDVAQDYKKPTDPNGKYYGVNVAIINFSTDLLGDRIKQIHQRENNKNPWYAMLSEARKNHELHWNEQYTEKDFYMMAAFQRKITSRRPEEITEGKTTGGTGLTSLINALSSKSDTYNCYVTTGDRILQFQHDTLELNSDDWVGFNLEKDFINALPEPDLLKQNKLFIPGVAYNLTFVLKEKEEIR